MVKVFFSFPRNLGNCSFLGTEICGKEQGFGEKLSHPDVKVKRRKSIGKVMNSKTEKLDSSEKQ